MTDEEKLSSARAYALANPTPEAWDAYYEAALPCCSHRSPMGFYQYAVIESDDANQDSVEFWEVFNTPPSKFGEHEGIDFVERITLGEFLSSSYGGSKEEWEEIQGSLWLDGHMVPYEVYG